MEETLKDLWERKITPEEAKQKLRNYPFEDLGFA